MNKTDLIASVAEKSALSKKDAEKAVNAFTEAVTEALKKGNKVQLVGFGVFEVKTRASRIGRNPRTGDQVPVPERRVVTFRPGKKMKELIADTTPGQGGSTAYDSAPSASEGTPGGGNEPPNTSSY